MTYDREPVPIWPSVDKLQDLARSEEWDTIDDFLQAGAADDPKYLDWAHTSTMDEDGNIRDLAVSIFESSSLPLDKDTETWLIESMRNDANKYVRFRCSFALFKHGRRDPLVLQKLHEALGDDEVTKIAQNYLAQQ